MDENLGAIVAAQNANLVGKADTQKPSVETSILRAAKLNKGVVSAGEIALVADIPMQEAKNALEKMVAQGNAEMHVRSNGVIVFTFKEFSENPTDDYVV